MSQTDISAVRAELGKILASPVFANSPRDADFPSTSVLLASCFIRQSKFDSAIAALQPIARDNPPALGRLGCAFAGLGRRQDAVNVLADLDALAKRQYDSPFPRAVVYLRLGDKERAFDWLAKAFDGMRNDPRYISLRNKLNLDGSPLSLQ